MSESGQSPYAVGLEKNAANYVALTPLTFIQRSAYIYPDRVAVIHGARRYTWRESYTRARRLASARTYPQLRWCVQRVQPQAGAPAL